MAEGRERASFHPARSAAVFLAAGSAGRRSGGSGSASGRLLKFIKEILEIHQGDLGNSSRRFLEFIKMILEIHQEDF
ncbi:MAG: hypothetical protein LBE06_09680 [Azoarcus sp.]|nr:hypothetical protein [Azoarcus sp.]